MKYKITPIKNLKEIEIESQTPLSAVKEAIETPLKFKVVNMKNNKTWTVNASDLKVWYEREWNK